MADTPKPIARFFGVLPPADPDIAGSAAIQWLGNFASPPLNPVLNDSYRDTTQKKSFIWNGTEWDIIATDGPTGAQGIQGIQGIQGPQGLPGTNANVVGLALPSGHQDSNTPFSTTSAVLVDVTGLFCSVTLTQTAKIFCLLNMNTNATGGGGATTVAVALNIDGVDTDEQHIDFTVADSDQAVTVSHITGDLAAGTYVIKARIRRVSGTQTAQFTAGMISGIGLCLG